MKFQTEILMMCFKLLNKLRTVENNRAEILEGSASVITNEFIED